MINKKITIIVTLILLFSIASLGCIVKQQQSPDEDVIPILDEDVVHERNISFETIAPRPSSFSGYKESKNYIIKQEQEWNSLRNKLHVSLPDVDFTQYMIIAAFQGIQRSGGHSIEITEIIESNDNITIHITKTSPDPNAFVTTVLTDPMHIVKLESSEKEIVFNVTDVISDVPLINISI